MVSLLLALVVVLVLAALVFGVLALLSGADPGLGEAEPDGRSVSLPTTRPLLESDLQEVRFDVTLRGYRMAQVDRALRRAAYDVGYKDEMIAVLTAEVDALREGRTEEADLLRKAREAADEPTRHAGSGTAIGGVESGEADTGSTGTAEVGPAEVSTEPDGAASSTRA